MDAHTPYNPLDKLNLGRSVEEALLSQSEGSLKEIAAFSGAGVYAIYYRGSFPLYAPLSAVNQAVGTQPIYVGKAVPKGGRKGAAMEVNLQTVALWSRLAEHSKSIEIVDSLDINDFTYRCLVVDDIWISLGESLMIERFQPLWNGVVEGFGNHDPGAGRYQGRRPLWDELHPGRVWAARCAAPKLNRAEIEARVLAYFAARD